MAEGPVAKCDNSIDDVQVSISIKKNETYIGDFLVFSFVFSFVFRSLILGGFVLGSIVSSSCDCDEGGEDDEL
jgi:hypothetical protein